MLVWGSVGFEVLQDVCVRRGRQPEPSGALAPSQPGRSQAPHLPPGPSGGAHNYMGFSQEQGYLFWGPYSKD